MLIYICWNMTSHQLLFLCHKYRLVFFTCYSTDSSFSLKMIKRIKKTNKSLLVFQLDWFLLFFCFFLLAILFLFRLQIKEFVKLKTLVSHTSCPHDMFIVWCASLPKKEEKHCFKSSKTSTRAARNVFVFLLDSSFLCFLLL